MYICCDSHNELNYNSYDNDKNHILLLGSKNKCDRMFP